MHGSCTNPTMDPACINILWLSVKKISGEIGIGPWTGGKKREREREREKFII